MFRRWLCYCVLLCFALNECVCRRHISQHQTDGRSETLSSRSQFSLVDVDKYVVVDAKTGIHYNPYSKHHPRRHVCLNQKPINQPNKSKQPYFKPIYKKYMVPCNDGTFEMCTALRVVYESQYKEDTSAFSPNESAYSCCPGWTQISPRSHGCNKPICTIPCLNGGKCIKPILCGCPKDFGGSRCEINLKKPTCKQQCKNGGQCLKEDYCSCPKGFGGDFCEIDFNKPHCSKGCENGGTCVRHELCRCMKGFGGRHCEVDVDECKELKPCDQICHNTVGSYNCQCREDFVLLEDGQSCRKEDSELPSETTDLEFEQLEQRLHKLETIMVENHKNEVSKSDLQNVYNDIEAMSKDVYTIKTKVDFMDHYKLEMLILKNKLHEMEKKAQKVDDLDIKYDRIKNCIFYNKLCY